MTPSPELAILRHLATRTTASATEIGAACAMSPGEVRGRLVMLESQRLIAGRPGKAAGERTPRRVYVITAEGRRAAGDHTPAPTRSGQTLSPGR
ncbi:helix-turn-helix transcriptional regulator [Lichenibacterium dinghuense]|uniref:helix-turn-helix transcriptional regulator n=1 Tax=Lichenibacterium dinghuense TaxID=2895977 RepID=UPI001F3EECFC|nr:helix-turn-helix transcriptional regulator [Lichenibacterium sp. 6Y81]